MNRRPELQPTQKTQIAREVYNTAFSDHRTMRQTQIGNFDNCPSHALAVKVWLGWEEIHPQAFAASTLILNTRQEPWIGGKFASKYHMMVGHYIKARYQNWLRAIR